MIIIATTSSMTNTGLLLLLFCPLRLVNIVVYVVVLVVCFGRASLHVRSRFVYGSNGLMATFDTWSTSFVFSSIFFCFGLGSKVASARPCLALQG